MMLAYYSRHPKLTQLCEALASCSQITETEAVRLVRSACADAGITELDVEMVQPDAASAVPFTPVAAQADTFVDAVSSQVARLLHGGAA